MSLPQQLLPECLKRGQRMPQVIVPLPPGYEVTMSAKPPDGTGYIFVGFMFGGHLADGSRIPSYDFVSGKGITWQATYVNKAPLETFRSSKFYLTEDYLYQYVPYGPRPVTEELQITITNTLDSLVYFSQTAFLFQLPLGVIMRVFK